MHSKLKYFDYPLEQGLRRCQTLVLPQWCCVFWLSIRTRIKTKFSHPERIQPVYFDYPLEQGLRHSLIRFLNNFLTLYFDYPLEQGLRRLLPALTSIRACEYFDYPLEQGLRHPNRGACQQLPHVFWLSIRTRIKTLHRRTGHLCQQCILIIH